MTLLYCGCSITKTDFKYGVRDPCVSLMVPQHIGVCTSLSRSEICGFESRRYRTGLPSSKGETPSKRAPLPVEVSRDNDEPQHPLWGHSSVGSERLFYKQEVLGSNPCVPTNFGSVVL